MKKGVRAQAASSSRSNNKSHLNKFQESAQRLFNDATKVQAISNNPQYQVLDRKYQSYLKSTPHTKLLLKELLQLLKKEVYVTQLALMEAPKTFQAMNATLLSMNKKINFIHYLIECVVPLHPDLDEVRIQLHNALWEDVTNSYRFIKALLGGNLAPLGENLILLELEKQYRQIVIKHSPYYAAFLDQIVQGEKPKLSPELLEAAKSKIWNGFENLINIQLDICFINKLVGAEAISAQAHDNAAAMIEKLGESIPQIVKVAHYDQASVEKALKEGLQKKLDWLSDYTPSFADQMLHNMYKTGNISTALMLAALSRLKEQAPSQDHPINLEHVIQDMGALILKNASRKLDDIQALTEANMDFNQSWTYVLQIEQVSLNQALVLLPHIDKLLLTWKNLFFHSTETVMVAKLLCERLEDLVKKSIETRLKLLSLEKTKEAAAKEAAAKEAAAKEAAAKEAAAKEAAAKEAAAKEAAAKEAAIKQATQSIENVPLESPEEKELEHKPVEEITFLLSDLKITSEKSAENQPTVEISKKTNIASMESTSASSAAKKPASKAQSRKNRTPQKSKAQPVEIKPLSIAQDNKPAKKEALPLLDETIENTAKLLTSLVLTPDPVKIKPELSIAVILSEEVVTPIIEPVTLELNSIQSETLFEPTVLKSDVNDNAITEPVVTFEVTGFQPVVSHDEIPAFIIDDVPVNVHLPVIPTGLTIPIHPEVTEMLMRLNKAGYWAVIVGGYVRDNLLFLPSNDVDIITNCPKVKLAAILDEPCLENLFISGLFKIKDMDVLCSELSLEAELSRRDLTINAFIADREGKVYDLLGNIADLAKPDLVMIGEVGERLAEDPSRILRLIQCSNHVNKGIPTDYFPAIYSNAHKLTHLPFGEYLKKIGSFFLNGKGGYNLSGLWHFNIYGFMTPPTNILFHHFPFESFWGYLANQMSEIDNTLAKEREKLYTSYSILGLLLLPEFCQRLQMTNSLSQAAEDVTAAFCKNYKGTFIEVEQSCFANSVRTLFEVHHADFQNYQISMQIALKSAAEQQQRYHKAHDGMRKKVSTPPKDSVKSDKAPKAPVVTQYNQSRGKGSADWRKPNQPTLGDFLVTSSSEPTPKLRQSTAKSIKAKPNSQGGF